MAFVIESLFAVVFLQALAGYLRRRDNLQRAVMFMFGSMAALFAVDLVRRTIPHPPGLVLDISSTLIFAQPYLTLRVIARLRPLPRSLSWSALVAYVVTVLPLVALPRPAPPGVRLIAVAVYILGGALASVLMIEEAVRRTGSPRVRLWLAGTGTGLMTVAFLTLLVGILRPAVQPFLSVAARGVALAAGLAYLVAFMPPGWLRRLWSGNAAYIVSRRLLYANVEEPPSATWQRYATTVREVASADASAVVAVGPDGKLVELASAGLPAGGPIGSSEWDVRQLLAASQPVAVRATGHPATATLQLAEAYAHRAGAHYVRAAKLTLPSGGLAAVLFINRYRSLFAVDDAQMLADLGGQAAALAERHQLTAELEASVAALATASQAKTEFLASMSHELRTPLNAIIGFSDLMSREPGGDGSHLVPADWITSVLSSGEHLLRIVNDVLDISKVEAGRLEIHRRDVSMPQAIGEVTANLRPLADRRGQRLTSRCAPVVVSADPIRLRQVVDNLLSNAIKFTPENGDIAVEVTRDGDGVQLAVADTGPGIAEADQQRIFDQFEQVGVSIGHQGGTGLGLALTRRLVEAHGGTIEVHSELGKGSRFVIFLPGPVTDLPEPAPMPVRTGGVLVIDDDPNAATLLRTHLQSAGYQVDVATSGEAGLAAAQAMRPVAILLDVHLPGMDGWQVLRAIREDASLREVPTFIVSVVDEFLAGRALGAIQAFVKPVGREQLLARLAEHVLAASPIAVPPRVLLIDDDPAWLQIVATDLRRSGAQVTTAPNAEQALLLASSQAFHLVVTDLIMPDTDGFRFVAMLHKDLAMQDTPILVMTAYDLTDAQRSRLDGKVLAVLAKDDQTGRQLRAFLETITTSAVLVSPQSTVPV
jgi:signal transduction histidine kinase/DNA-binding response OmpR family regulator